MSKRTKYWLFKSEPGEFSIADLAAAPDAKTHWDGVRNYQARNFMRDQMHVGDRVLYYHSGGKEPAIVGTAVVVGEAYSDHTAWDPKNKHYDPKATPDNPIWVMVDIQHEQTFDEPITRDQLRGLAALKEMELLRKGSRLSVQPVRKKEFDAIMKLAARARK